MKCRPIIGILVLTLSCLTAETAVAHAEADPSISPRVCANDEAWKFTNKTTDVYISGSERAYGDAGVTVSITQGESTTWTGSVTGGVTAEAGVIFAKASATFSVTVSYARTTTVSKTGSWTIPASATKGGYLEAGAAGISFNYEKTYWVSPCTKKTATGLAKGLVPSSNIWFKKVTL